MPPVPKPLLGIHAANEKQVREILKQASKEAGERIAALGSQSIRAAQLSGATSVIDQAFIDIGKATQDSVFDAAAESAKLAEGPMGDVLRANGFTPAEVNAYMRGSITAAQVNVQRAVDRLNNFAYDYSERVYRSDVIAKGWLNNTVSAAIAQGQSYTELSNTVRKWVSPDTPGGAKYAADRLARTEINNAFHATSVDKYSQQPWIAGVRWNLSASHTRVDVCNEFADTVHMTKGDPGVYNPLEVPAKPHPQCFCFITAVQISDEEFLNSLVNGEYDDYIDNNLMMGGSTLKTADKIDDVVADATTETAPTAQTTAAKENWDNALQGEREFDNIFQEGNDFIAEELDDEAREMISMVGAEWSNGDWQAINEALFSGRSMEGSLRYHASMDDFLENADDAFEMVSDAFYDDIVVSRITSTGFDNIDTLLKSDVGASFTSKGYTATTMIDPQLLNGIGGDVVMDILVPEGTKFLPVGVSGSRYAGASAEKEILLNRDITFTLADKPSKLPNGKWYVKLVAS